MKKLFYLIVMVTIGFAITSCNNNQRSYDQQKPEINITSEVNPSEGLDLQLVGALIQDGKCKNGEDLERELNADGGINNLDIDGNNSIDYINVTENNPNGNNSARSFDLTTGDESNLTHIATIEVAKVGGEYNVNMSGNQEIYGNNCNYNAHYGPSVGEIMFLSWMFSPRPVYYHPYYYHGYYPSYYGRSYSRPMVVSRSAYNQRTSVQRTTVTKTVTRTTTAPKSSIKSSNQGKVSPSYSSKRTSFNNNSSSSSQKSFQTRNTSKPVSKGGFTKGSSSSSSYSRPSSSSSNSYSRPSSSSSRSSFGSSNKSSFGSSGRSSSSRSSSSSKSRSSSRR